MIAEKDVTDFLDLKTFITLDKLSVISNLWTGFKHATL